MDDLAAVIGTAIRRERSRARLSQEAVAQALGLDRAVVARIEAGQRSLRMDAELERLCDVLDCTVKRLLLDATAEQRARFGL